MVIMQTVILMIGSDSHDNDMFNRHTSRHADITNDCTTLDVTLSIGNRIHNIRGLSFIKSIR